jgi:hypothetical protein
MLLLIILYVDNAIYVGRGEDAPDGVDEGQQKQDNKKKPGNMIK